MPRTADHAQRRGQIAAAVHSIALHLGLDAVTVARTAAEAGVSVGLVQHYFPTKDELLRCAYAQALDRVEQRVAGHIAAGESARRPIAAVVSAALAEMLPLDEERRGEQRVMRSFTSRVAGSAHLAADAAATSARIRVQLATAVANGKECGEVAPSLDALRAAIGLQALTDGLATQVLLEPRTDLQGRPLAEHARAVLHDALAQVFTGECRQYA